jgi:hypothetical protein
MSSEIPLFTGAFPAGAAEEFSGSGKRPVIFDIVGADMETSILPEDLKLVLHVNPKSMSLRYEKLIERIQTKGGFVEQHFGDGTRTMELDAATGGFMRLYAGISMTTDPKKTGGSRRETLAYDSYLDLLAMFHNNGSVYDLNGQVAIQGAIKVTFDGGVYTGWFTSFSVTEDAQGPYQFQMTASLEIEKEIQVWKTVFSTPQPEKEEKK